MHEVTDRFAKIMPDNRLIMTVFINLPLTMILLVSSGDYNYYDSTSIRLQFDSTALRPFDDR